MTTPITGSPLMPPSRPTRAGVAAGPDEAAQRLAWQREMEQAQLGAWFRSPGPQKQGLPPASSRSPSAADRTGAEAAQGRTVKAQGPTPPRVDSMPAVTARAAGNVTMTAHSSLAPQVDVRRLAASHREGVPPIDERTGPANNTPAVGKLHRTLDSQGLQRETTPTGSPSSGSDATTTRTGEQPAIRLHMEHAPEGATVWIAMHDQDAVQGPMVASLLKELRSEFTARGERLHKLICNGRLLWRDGDPGHDIRSLDGAIQRPFADDHSSLLHPTVSKDA